MKFTVLSLFPEILDGYFSASIMNKAVERGIIQYSLINIRDYAVDTHRTCDDAPYGGGAGMVLKPDPLARAIQVTNHSDCPVVYVTPFGKPLNQDRVKSLAAEKELIIVCGRYEGIDQRIIDRYVDHEISVGDFVLSSGEVAALSLIDSVYRFCDGLINNESLIEESFEGHLLEYPHYTRPEAFDGMKVPDILLSGHHEKIRLWRLEKRIAKTAENRPDLLEKALQDDEIKKIYDIIGNRGAGDECYTGD